MWSVKKTEIYFDMTSCTPCHMQLVSLNYRLYDQSHERPTVVNNVDEISGPTIAELRIPADLSPLWFVTFIFNVRTFIL